MSFASVIIESDLSRQSIADDSAKHNEGIGAWISERGAKGKLLAGQAFETAETKPVTVRFGDDGATVTEEPFAAGSETLDGYVVVEVADRNEAVELAKSWPTGRQSK